MSAGTQRLAKELKGTLGDNETVTDFDDYANIVDFVFWKSAADGAAGNASSVFSFKAPFDFIVQECVIGPDTTLTADNTNNAVLTLGKADGAGGANTTIGTLTTNVASGNWAADTFKSLTLTASAVSVTKGQIVTMKITKGGTGVVVPISSYTLKVKKN